MENLMENLEKFMEKQCIATVAQVMQCYSKFNATKNTRTAVMILIISTIMVVQTMNGNYRSIKQQLQAVDGVFCCVLDTEFNKVHK